MQKLTFFIVLAGLFPALVFSQVKNQSDTDVTGLLESSFYDYQRSSGIFGFDPSKIKMNHSYSLSFGSFGAQSITQGLYLNTISYQFNAPLSVKFQWGFYHQPFATGMPNNLTSQLFISGAELKYQPFNNTTLKLQFRQYPRGYYSPYNYQGYGWRDRFYQESWFDEE